MELINPFDNEGLEFRVLVNSLNQHSLWPTSIPIPEGWRAIGPRGRRSECLDWVDRNWTDITPIARST